MIGASKTSAATYNGAMRNEPSVPGRRRSMPRMMSILREPGPSGWRELVVYEAVRLVMLIVPVWLLLVAGVSIVVAILVALAGLIVHSVGFVAWVRYGRPKVAERQASHT